MKKNIDNKKSVSNVTLKTVKNKLLKNKKFTACYNILEEEFNFVDILVKARIDSGLTQKQIAQRMQTKQSVVARMESGKSIPTTRTLKKFASAIGKKLQISFVK